MEKKLPSKQQNTLNTIGWMNETQQYQHYPKPNNQPQTPQFKIKSVS
jgi:hypothetical protein